MAEEKETGRGNVRMTEIFIKQQCIAQCVIICSGRVHMH